MYNTIKPGQIYRRDNIDYVIIKQNGPFPTAWYISSKKLNMLVLGKDLVENYFKINVAESTFTRDEIKIMLID